VSVVTRKGRQFATFHAELKLTTFPTAHTLSNAIGISRFDPVAIFGLYLFIRCPSLLVLPHVRETGDGPVHKERVSAMTGYGDNVGWHSIKRHIATSRELKREQA
jgi:hypothetical protein